MLREFGAILVALASRGEGKISLDGRDIFVFASKSGWTLVTKVSVKTPFEMKGGFSYPFTLQGSLIINEGVDFIYRVPKLDRYVAFRNVVKNYLEEADNWCKIFN